jgi:hypothetical protein
VIILRSLATRERVSFVILVRTSAINPFRLMIPFFFRFIPAGVATAVRMASLLDAGTSSSATSGQNDIMTNRFMHDCLTENLSALASLVTPHFPNSQWLQNSA